MERQRFGITFLIQSLRIVPDVPETVYDELVDYLTIKCFLVNYFNFKRR